MEILNGMVKDQEFQIMKNLLYAKNIVVDGESSQEMLKKASELLQTVDQGYTKLKILAQNASDFEKQVLTRKIAAYKVKCEEIQNELAKIRKDESPNITVKDCMDSTLASGLRSHEIGVNTLGRLQSQRAAVEKFAKWSFKKEINESNSALINLYVKKSKIKVSLVIIIILQVFIFLLVLKIKLS